MLYQANKNIVSTKKINNKQIIEDRNLNSLETSINLLKENDESKVFELRKIFNQKSNNNNKRFCFKHFFEDDYRFNISKNKYPFLRLMRLSKEYLAQKSQKKLKPLNFGIENNSNLLNSEHSYLHSPLNLNTAKQKEKSPPKNAKNICKNENQIEENSQMQIKKINFFSRFQSNH